ncbi:MAG: nucleoside transporter [Lentisphaerae bacterium]|nr:nucleoside transporter [Lentisphaerota bacterium]
MNAWNLVSVAGIAMMMSVAWAFSEDRRNINWHTVAWGCGLQFAIGALVFLVPGSQKVFLLANEAVLKVLGAAQAGQRFLFGNLADAGFAGFVLATQALPIIIFFSALMGLLYYCGVMSVIIRCFARLFSRLMRVSGAESLCVASNIFVGIESVTAVRPLLDRMTRSELCTILTAGMATVASSTMGMYVLFLADRFPMIAGHMVSASIMSAPAALVMSKLLVPESGAPETLGLNVTVPRNPEDRGWIDAIVNGAMAGARLVAGVCAVLIAFLGLVALVDMIFGAATGFLPGGRVTLTRVLGWVFHPFAIAMGIPPGDAGWAGALLGKRFIMTEIPAYQGLAAQLANGGVGHARSAVIVSYALCGFAHVASLAVFVGGAAAMAPSRRADLVSVGPRALLAATLACLMTGAVAGACYRDGGGTTLNLQPERPTQAAHPHG